MNSSRVKTSRDSRKRSVIDGLVFIGTSLHVEIYVFGSIHEHQALRTADSLEGGSRRG